MTDFKKKKKHLKLTFAQTLLLNTNGGKGSLGLSYLSGCHTAETRFSRTLYECKGVSLNAVSSWGDLLCLIDIKVQELATFECRSLEHLLVFVLPVTRALLVCIQLQHERKKLYRYVLWPS